MDQTMLATSLHAVASKVSGYHLAQGGGFWATGGLTARKVSGTGGAETAGIERGRPWRSINRGGRVWGEGPTEKVIWQVVEQCATDAGLPNTAPHDLCRTSAKLCRAGGGSWSRSRCCWGTRASKPRSSTSGRARILRTRRTIIGGWGLRSEGHRGTVDRNQSES
jgi:hypothetical protein